MGFDGEAQPPLLRRVIGSVLRRIRQRQGRTLRDVAGAADVSVPYLSELERGRKEPSSEVLASICRALGLHLVELLDEVRDELSRVQPAVPTRVPVRRGPRFAVGSPAAPASPAASPAGPASPAALPAGPASPVRASPVAPAHVAPAGSRPRGPRPPAARCQVSRRRVMSRRPVFCR